MLELSFEIDGKVVHRRLEVASDQFKTLKEPMDDIGRTLLKTFDTNFASRGGEYGGWKPRKPQYSGTRRIDTWPLMERTGRLRRGFRQDTGNFSVRLYNPTPYFRYHQLGTARLPKRVMMSLRQQDGRMIVSTVQRYVIESLRKAGLR